MRHSISGFYNTSINWSDPVKMVLIGPHILAEMEHEMLVIKKNLQETQDMKKTYADQHRFFKES